MVTKGANLCVRDLEGGYGERQVLRAVGLQIAAGCLTVLVGANGSGKSTLLRHMGRILRPTSGAVLLDGADIHALPTRQVARKMGLLSQGPIPPEGMTLRDLVAQGRLPHQRLFHGQSDADRTAIADAMDMAGVAHLADRPLDALSGGQRQRGWIAMVLAQETEILLLDEPTTFLDLKVQIEVMELLRRLSRDHGRTLVVVLHELNLAAAYADHLVMMKDGAVIETGLPSDVFTEHNLKRVFDLDARIVRDAESGLRFCLPYARGATA